MISTCSVCSRTVPSGFWFCSDKCREKKRIKEVRS